MYWLRVRACDHIERAATNREKRKEKKREKKRETKRKKKRMFGVFLHCTAVLNCDSGHPRPSRCPGPSVPWVSLPSGVPSDAQAGWHRGQSANPHLLHCCTAAALLSRATRHTPFGQAHVSWVLAYLDSLCHLHAVRDFLMYSASPSTTMITFSSSSLFSSSSSP